MNIFILDNNIAKSAEYYADQHVWSCLNEIPIMMSCAFKGLSQAPVCKTFREDNKEIYYHDWTKWIRESKENFLWTIMMWSKLEWQSVLRFNAPRHRYLEFIRWCNKNIDTVQFIGKELTPFPLVFKIGTTARQLADKGITDTVELYRQYYKEKPELKWIVKKPNWL